MFKKTVVSLITILLFVLLVGCDNENISKKELDEAWGSEFNYAADYGKINDYHVFLYVDDMEEHQSFRIEQNVFRYNNAFNIYLYQNGKFVTLSKAYVRDFINDEDIQRIYEIHKNKSQAVLNLNDTDYNKVDNVDVIYDYFGNKIKGIKPIDESILEELKKRIDFFGTYLGEYEGYYAVLDISSKWSDIYHFFINETFFNLSDSTSIYLYKEGDIVDIKTACLNKLVSDESLRSISYHLNKYRAELIKENTVTDKEMYLMDIEYNHSYGYYYRNNTNIEEYYNNAIINCVSETEYDILNLQDYVSMKLNCDIDYLNILGSFDYDSKELICFVEDENALSNLYEINGYKFYNDAKFKLVVVNEKEVYDLFDAYNAGLISQDAFAIICQKFRVLQRITTFSHLDDKEFKEIYPN